MVYPYLTYHDEILVSEKSSLAKRPFVAIEDIRDKPFAVVNEDLRALVEEMVRPVYCTLTPDTGFRDKLVESNEAVSIVPSITRLNPLSSATVQVPLADGWDATLAFVGRTNLLNNRSIKQVLNILNSCYVRDDDEMDQYYTVHFAG